MSLTVTIADRSGRPVADLTPDDSQIQEDGDPQKLLYFILGSDEGGVPLHIGLLFDTSESMEQDLAFSRDRFLNLFSNAADFSLVDFDTEVRAARFLQSEFPRLVERTRNRPAKGFTALYDAISVYLGEPSTSAAGRSLSCSPTAATPRAPAPGPKRFECCAPPTSRCIPSGSWAIRRPRLGSCSRTG